MKGRILIINPGSTSTKIGFYEDGQQLFETNLTHSAEEIAKYDFIKIVEELPDEGLPNRIYLVPHEAEEGSNDLFDMWLWVNDAWEFEGTKSAEIDDKRYVKFTDYATADKAGVGKANTNFGISITGGGEYYLVPAYDNEIINQSNSSYKALLPRHISKVVKVGITTSTETWTDEDKANACKTIGAFPNVLTSLDGDGYIPFYNPNTEEYGYKRAYGSFIGKNAVVMRDENGDIRGKTPTAASAGTVLVNKEYVETNKGTKLYKHTITGFVGGTETANITSITLISTSNTDITGASNLDLVYTQYGLTANTAYGKIVNLVQTMTDEITMQFHNRLAGGEIETVELDASNITDAIEVL